MRNFIFTAVLLWLSQPAALGAQTTPAPQIFFQPQALCDEVLRYRMISGKTVVGEMKVNLAHGESGEVIHVVESLSGLFERSTALALRNDSTLQPLSSTTVFSNSNRFHTVRLNYGADVVAGQIHQPVEYGGLQEIQQELAGGSHDFFAVPYLLRAHALAPNQAFIFPIFDFRQKKVDRARAWVAKKETVAAPAGEFACYRVEGFSGELRWIFLLEEKFPHRLVKQIFPALEIELELVEITSGLENETVKAAR